MIARLLAAVLLGPSLALLPYSIWLADANVRQDRRGGALICWACAGVQMAISAVSLWLLLR